MIHTDCAANIELRDACGCDVVRKNWLAFTEPLEGGIPHLYADIRGIPTIAYGNAVFTAGEASALPLMHPGGVEGSTAEKVAAWLAVKGDPRAPTLGHRYAAQLTTLRLTKEGMGKLALGKLASNEAVLRKRLHNWDDLPACAQMALHSLAWACGPAFHFPRLISAVEARDFDAASVHIHMNEWTPEGRLNAGLVPRNVANKILMRNAARVQAFNLDPDTLDWVHDLDVAEAETQRELPSAASEPTIYVVPPEEVTGSGPTLHRLRYEPEPDDDDAA